ncbi:hypothetical protein FBY33_0660 [Arthrobacter sp. SLBN-112]|jgi:hypothetical protein|uniref:DMP19 family protein n=1 Tax=Arthrobacter sp. SLBN-112 TaxID=2768452 RepID=UPI00116FFE86|nr:hypothetical protein [Arthrobacter sp. SLBN-112]TQJ38661.1 hypothetical protein FBY33_0660 [Arthrobacter sp. SLBN-112]
MTTSQQPVVLTSSSIDGRDEEVVEANVAIIDAMHNALLGAELMSPVAVRSYFVDFYLCQALEGGFAQYAVMAAARTATDALVREGMAGMGATAHFDLFNRAVAAYDVLTAAYLEGPGGTGPLPDGVFRMDELDGEFEELLEHENITALNARWLCGQPDLLVLDDEEVGPYIQRLAALVPDLAGRRVARAGAAASRIVGALRNSRNGPAIPNVSSDLGAEKEKSSQP